MFLNDEIKSELIGLGADFIYFVDISRLSATQNRGYSNAIIFGLILTPNYIREVADTLNYVSDRVKNDGGFEDDELYIKECKTDALADYIANHINRKGYSAYSQSDANQIRTSDFDGIYGKTHLPHKTIATLAGLGWIGKNNLLITPQFGSAQCIGSVLTDAPLKTALHSVNEPLCGNCSICVGICDTNALKGRVWNIDTARQDMIDVYKCTTCMKCMVFCPWTQSYIKKH